MTSKLQQTLYLLSCNWKFWRWSGCEILGWNCIIFLPFPQQSNTYTAVREDSQSAQELLTAGTPCPKHLHSLSVFPETARPSTPSFGRWYVMLNLTDRRVKAKSWGCCQHRGTYWDIRLQAWPCGSQEGGKWCILAPFSWHKDQAVHLLPLWALIVALMDSAWSHTGFARQDSSDPVCPQLVTVHPDSPEGKQLSLWQESHLPRLPSLIACRWMHTCIQRTSFSNLEIIWSTYIDLPKVLEGWADVPVFHT